MRGTAAIRHARSCSPERFGTLSTQIEHMANAVALSGAVIVSQTISQIVYKRKCEKCGDVSGSTTTTSSVSSGQTYGSQFKCFKCNNTQRIQIKGS